MGGRAVLHWWMDMFCTGIWLSSKQQGHLLPPCALLKQNLWKVNRNNTRDNNLDFSTVTALHQWKYFSSQQKSTEGSNTASTSFIWTRAGFPARRALPPKRVLKRITPETTADKATQKERKEHRERGPFIHTVCARIGECPGTCAMNTIRNCKNASTQDAGSEIHLCFHFPE